MLKKLENQELKKGKGFLTNLAKAGMKALAPVLIDAASNTAKNKIAGTGAKKRTTKKTTKRGRPRKTKSGTSLMPAGY